VRQWTVQVLPAGRKWDRMFSDAVARSIAKTVTEPVTNSYDSYKLDGRLPAASGIVDALLRLKEGDSVSHDSLVSQLPRRPPVSVRVVLATSKTAGGLRKRECRVVDEAAGMDSDELQRSLQFYGEEKSGQPQGKPVRGLFGQGLSDVLFGHGEGRIISFKGRLFREVKVRRDENRQPHADLVVERQATPAERRAWGIPDNGTCVSLILTKGCHVPDPESLYERLCNFYMLRLINADPACRVLLQQHRTARRKIAHELGYNFPPGTVVGRFSTSWTFEDYPPIHIEGLAVHSLDPLSQGSGLDKEQREGGFLVVDEHDTVYDLTLFGFETKPGLDHLYGVVRLSGAPRIITDLLSRSQRKAAVITDSRDGFDQRTDFARALWREVYPLLRPIVDAEAELATREVQISEETDKRVKRAFRELNELFKAETEGEGPIQPEPEPVTGIRFDADGPLQLRAGTPRNVHLLAEAAAFDPHSEIILDTTTPEISVVPARLLVSGVRARKGVRTFQLRVVGNSVGARGKVEALAETRGGDILNAELVISRVVPPLLLVPPEHGLEFRPPLASAPPHRRGSIFLFLDLDRVPFGSEIHVRMDKAPAGLTLLAPDDTAVRALAPVRVSEDHAVDGTSIGRIPIHFRGQAKGQEGNVVAKARGRSRRSYKTSALLRVTDPALDSTGGIFNKPDYHPLPGRQLTAFDEPIGVIYLNSNHPLNRAFFGEDRQSFWRAVDESQPAQLWLAQAVLEEAMYHILEAKRLATGERGFRLEEHDPIGSIRRQMEEWKYTKGADVFRALAPAFVVPEPQD